MISHSELRATGFAGSKRLAWLIRNNRVCFAGNRKLRIYGSLSCVSGKRMKTANRVFFANEAEAIEKGYRPCAHCLYGKYRLWRRN